tara:strand:- start:1081 stop:2022 length:942 start_codon:yes stop_codon:yes gene_type:complete
MTHLDNQIRNIQIEIQNNSNAGRRSGLPEPYTISHLEYLIQEYLVSASAEERTLSGNAYAEAGQLLRNLKILRNLEEENKHLVEIQPPAKFTYNYTSIHGTFTTEAETEPQAYSMFLDWLEQKDKEVIPEPVIVEPTPAPIETPLVTEPVYIEATPIITPTVDDSINTNMVTQQVINFNIVDGRAIGSIKFLATNNFNPYYYNKEIVNLVQFKTPNGATLLTKLNRLRFTQTERDEVINYNENIQENTRITVESFVWEFQESPEGAFSNMYSIEISEAEPPKPTQGGIMGAGVAGAIGLLILGGFLIDSRRKK